MSDCLQDLTQAPLLPAREELALGRWVVLGRRAREVMCQRWLWDMALTEGERADLEAAVAEGRQAQTVLVERNTRLVVRVAEAFRGKGVTREDVVQEGCLGLIEAASHYDPDHCNERRPGEPVRFSTYAWRWIYQAMQRGIPRQRGALTVPLWTRDRLGKALDVEAELTALQGQCPDMEEVGARVGLGGEAIRQGLRALRRPVEAGQADALDDDGEDPAEQAATSDLAARVSQLLDSLPDRHAETLRCRFGVGMERGLNPRETGARLGVGPERVRQIQREGLTAMGSLPDAWALWNALEPRGMVGTMGMVV